MRDGKIASPHILVRKLRREVHASQSRDATSARGSGTIVSKLRREISRARWGLVPQIHFAGTPE